MLDKIVGSRELEAGSLKGLCQSSDFWRLTPLSL